MHRLGLDFKLQLVWTWGLAEKVAQAYVSVCERERQMSGRD